MRALRFKIRNLISFVTATMRTGRESRCSDNGETWNKSITNYAKRDVDATLGDFDLGCGKV